MRRGRAPSWTAEDGYTLIELLVTVVIVGILSSIALAAFTTQTSKAQGAAAKTLARTAQAAMETHFLTVETYETDAAGLVAIEPALGEARGFSVEGTEATYRVSLLDSRGRTFGVQRSRTGGVVRFCAPAGAGVCPADGRW